ncbi:hypothetical protein BB559_004201 [Furculomyces boomerangus]|uniref:Nuclear movement protein nudC n=2 Tax=Harpellales TaxID=61421 RepID=A0A2T9YFZ8_9FUNG|nr:hypothetical protein BB559_004201 [Furculomyces boomerangus]PWA00008.1 hypothetical protein BB558_003964 [Smittium angustum]
MNGNGTKEELYEWKQTLSEVDISSDLEQGTRARDLIVVINPQHVSAKYRSTGKVLIEGELPYSIIVDDSTWSIDDKKKLEIHLEKSNKMQWWKSAIVGATEIDTSKIEPENSKLSDLTGETRAMVEKMMFDQQQKSLGKPDTDQLKKQQMLQNFKNSHPELDFSNAKFDEN